ncbi:hypothetical protein ACH4SP_15615 [Streptomyces sp. NPDC021093]|uniref:hypothetical protein n=1 Tax=Streptomyces sp. NPDC021093 TaxID=3365112 RepID=UPI00379CCF0C
MNVRHVLAAAVATAALSATAAPVAYAADAPAELPSCSDVGSGGSGYEMKLLDSTMSEATGPVVAGGDWYTYTVTVTSTSADELKDVGRSVALARQTENGEDQPGPWMDVEYKSKETGQWVALEGHGGPLTTLGTLKPKESVTQEVRMRAAKDTPEVINFIDSYFSASVDDVYVDPSTGTKTPCRGSMTAMDSFGVKQAGTTPEPTRTPGPKPTTTAKPTAKPTAEPTATATPSGGPSESGKPSGKPTATPSTVPTATGSASPAPQLAGNAGGTGVTGGTANLASTGTSGALPIVGLAGGAAVLLGAVAVVVVRRKGRV